MNKLISIALTSLFAANLAFAQTPAPAIPAKPAAPVAAPATVPAAVVAPAAVAPAPAGGCEAQAVSKAGKPLHGAAKAAFMKKCNKGNPAPATGKAAQQEKMKACNAGAKGKKGAERKAFMKDCLSK